jgi:pimeloyl-ACP methyl ester carboxylesterase
LNARSRVALALCGFTLVAALAAAAPTPPVTLHTSEFGHGPTLVLVHGLGAARLGWMPTTRKLLSNYHVVMVDLPGHGDSPLPDPFSLEAAADALDLVIARQPPDSTVVVGQGVGGLLALMSASLHPEHQKGLVLIDVGLKSPLPIDDQQKKQFLDFMEQNYDQVSTMIFSRMGRDSAQGVQVQAMAAQVPPATIKAYLRRLLDADATRAVRSLKTPVLVVMSEKRLPPDKDWAVVGKEMGWEDPASHPPRRIAHSAALIASDQPDTLALVISDFAKQAMAKK